MQKAEVVTEETTTDIEKFETRHPAPMPAIRTDSPMDAVMVAMEKGYSPEFIEKMMDLQERNEKNEARKAYHAAVAAFKAVAPKIKRINSTPGFNRGIRLLETYWIPTIRFSVNVVFPYLFRRARPQEIPCLLSANYLMSWATANQLLWLHRLTRPPLGKQAARNPETLFRTFGQLLPISGQ